MTLWQAENQHEGSQELQKVDDRRQQHQLNQELGWQQQRRLICDRGNPSLPTEEATHPGHVGDVVSKTEAKVSKTEAKQLAGKPLSCKAKASAKATGEEEQEVNREKQGAAAGVEGAVAVLEPAAVAQRPGAASLLILKPATKQIE